MSSILGQMDDINFVVKPVTFRYRVGDAVVTTAGFHGTVVDREVMANEKLYTVRLDDNASGTITVSESYLYRKYIPPVQCECGAEAVFGKDTVLHSATMPCPKYKPAHL